MLPDQSNFPATDADEVIIRVCECGVIADDRHFARCGQDLRRNLRSGCPYTRMRVVAWEHADAS